MFIIKTLIDIKYVKSKLQKKRNLLFLCFVDFRKGIDCIPWQKLFDKLRKEGIQRRFLQVLISMHSTDKSTVKIDNKLTQFFPCYSGMKQEHFITANWIIDKILDFSFVHKNYQLLGRNDLFPFQILPFYSSYLSAIQDKTKGIFSLTDVLIHQTTVDSL